MRVRRPTSVAGLAIGALAAMVAGVAGCGGSSAPPLPAGSLRVPVDVVRVDGAATGAYARVEVRGRTYSFRVDTGAGRTFVVASLARALGVGPLGRTVQAQTIGCTIPVREASLGDWSLGGHALPTETVGVEALSGGGARLDGAPYAGLLGADALSGFGVIQLDVAHSELTLGGALRAGGPHLAPMPVIHPRGDTVPTTTVTVRGRRATWVVDTGASISFVSRADPQVSEIAFDPGQPITVHSPTCTSTVRLLHPAPWSAGTIVLPNLPIASGASHVTVSGPGILGDDVISHYGSVTLDFTHQRVSYGD